MKPPKTSNRYNKDRVWVVGSDVWCAAAVSYTPLRRSSRNLRNYLEHYIAQRKDGPDDRETRVYTDSLGRGHLANR
jgi:hypothetical protein